MSFWDEYNKKACVENYIIVICFFIPKTEFRKFLNDFSLLN